MIIDPVQPFCNNTVYAAAIVKLVRSQHEREVRFERVEFRTTVPTLVIDELADFVGRVEWYEETVSDGDET